MSQPRRSRTILGAFVLVLALGFGAATLTDPGLLPFRDGDSPPDGNERSGADDDGSGSPGETGGGSAPPLEGSEPLARPVARDAGEVCDATNRRADERARALLGSRGLSAGAPRLRRFLQERAAIYDEGLDRLARLPGAGADRGRLDRLVAAGRAGTRAMRRARDPRRFIASGNPFLEFNRLAVIAGVAPCAR